MKRFKDRGFTLIELMVTVAIIILVSSIGFVSMSGYLPKQRLKATGHYIENILIRAQAEAYSRGTRVGVFFREAGGKTNAVMFMDSDTGGTAFQKDASEGELTSVLFRTDVRISSGPGANCAASCASPSIGCYVFFNAAGEAVDTTPPDGNLTDYQLFIYNDKLDVPYNSREIEALSSGLVQLIKQGQAGNATPVETHLNCTS